MQNDNLGLLGFIIILVVLFQIMQWAWAFYNLCDDDELNINRFRSKKDFFIALIPGFFLVYTFRWIIDTFEKFITLP